MMSGFSMFSFDLFGLGRRADAGTAEDRKKSISAARAKEEAGKDRRLPEPRDGEIFFWGMFPVL